MTASNSCVRNWWGRVDPPVLTSSFAAAVSTYDAAALPQRLAAERLASEACSRMVADGSLGAKAPRHTLIDLGCGTGLMSRAWLDQLQVQAHPLPQQLWLVDQAPSMVERAVALLHQRHGAVQGDVLDAFSPAGLSSLASQLPNQGTRLLVSSYALQWSEQPLVVLREVWSILLRPGDWLAVAMPDQCSFAVLHAALSAAGLPSHFLKLPCHEALIGEEGQAALASRFQWVAGGGFANAVPVESALAYLRHFNLIGASPVRSPYSRRQLMGLLRCLDQQLSRGVAELDYHSSWMLLRRC